MVVAAWCMYPELTWAVVIFGSITGRGKSLPAIITSENLLKPILTVTPPKVLVIFIV